jgi:hypothetical protein
MAGKKHSKGGREMVMGTPPELVPVKSNRVTSVRRPTIKKVIELPGEEGDRVDVKRLQVWTDMEIGPAQSVSLLLNELSVRSSRSYRFEVGARAQNSHNIVVPIPLVESGTYLVRVEVNGAESPLELDSDPTSPTHNHYIGPKVIIR